MNDLDPNNGNIPRLSQTPVPINGDIDSLFATAFELVNSETSKPRSFDVQGRAVAQQKKDHAKDNTSKCYDSKQLEFNNYLKSIFEKDEKDTWHLITPDKVFGFIYYQANRKKKKGRKPVGFFDISDFDKTMNYTSDQLADVVGTQAINQYLCAIRKLVQNQFETGMISHRKEDLMTTKMNDIIDVVKGRGEKVLKKHFKERATDDFQPYRILNEIPNIEQYMWKIHCKTKIYSTNSLRDRFQFLFSLSAVLRSDSIYKADLSDLCDFKFKQKREPDPYHVCILRVGEGKTVHQKAQFGKMMRHVNVNMCAIGALAFWIFARFMVTSEHEKIDFTKNHTWFNIKLLCAVDKTNSTTHGKCFLF